MRDRYDYFDYFPDQLGITAVPDQDTSGVQPFVIPPEIYDTPNPGEPPNPGPPDTPPIDPPALAPAPTPYSSGSAGPSGGGGFAWPKFNAPTFQAPPAFQYEAFKAPQFSDIYQDPTYQGRRNEGMRAIEHSAAAKGLTRLPETVKALSGWNQDFAAREYGNIFDRAAQTYDRNRANAADTYSMNYGVSRDVFDRDYQGKKDMFDFNEWRPSQLTFEDMYRRYKANLDSQTQIAVAGFGRP